MSRPDLLALSHDSLAALTNRGLLKRALKAIESGETPVLSTTDGVVSAVFGEGITTTLAPGGLDRATCTCGASGPCRHVLTAVLAYQRSEQQPAETPPGGDDWTPGMFGDADLEDLLGSRTMATAQRILRAGYAARVRRGATPQVELPSCTVQFLVPQQLAYTHTDAKQGTGQEAVALAVWAFRAADAKDPAAPELHIHVGGEARKADDFAYAIDLASEVLLDGVANLGVGLAARFTVVRQALDAASLRWPLLAMEELEQQLTAYDRRDAGYRAELTAELIAEMHARRRAAAAGGASPRTRVLGTQEAAEVQLRRVRLTGLGCRVSATDAAPAVKVFLADADNGNVLVLENKLHGRVAGVGMPALATGNVVTESAARSASRRVRLANSRIARTTVTPSLGAWEKLPKTTLVQDVSALLAELGALPPRLIRPRVEAESVRVIAIGEVGPVRYLPGDQRLQADIAGESGGTATISAVHRAIAPAALDAIADALAANPRFVSGTVRRTSGTVIIDPLAIVCDSGVVVPDLAQGAGDSALEDGATSPPGPLAEAVGDALTVLADIAHRGLRHLPPTFPGHLAVAAKSLAGVGFSLAAQDLDLLASAIMASPEHGVSAWADAEIRLLTTYDLIGAEIRLHG